MPFSVAPVAPDCSPFWGDPKFKFCGYWNSPFPKRGKLSCLLRSRVLKWRQWPIFPESLTPSVLVGYLYFVAPLRLSRPKSHSHRTKHPSWWKQRTDCSVWNLRVFDPWSWTKHLQKPAYGAPQLLGTGYSLECFPAWKSISSSRGSKVQHRR